MLHAPSNSPTARPGIDLTTGAADRRRPRSDPGTSAAPPPQPALPNHGADLSALQALRPTRPTELSALPNEVQADITQYLTPRHIGLYADALDPSVVPPAERAAAALSVRIEGARSLRQIEACVAEAIALDPAVRHRPIHEALCRLKTSRHWRETSGEKQRVEALVDRCLEAARQMQSNRASRIVATCGVLRFVLRTVGNGDASDLAVRVLAEVPAMPAADRPRALREALAFVGQQIHSGEPQTLPGKRLHLVVSACLEQGDRLPLQQREDLVRTVSGLAGQWQARTAQPWMEVEQPLMAHLAGLPAASLPDAITPSGTIFERLVTRLLQAMPVEERGAFLDQLIGAVPCDPQVRGECLVNIATLMPLIPLSQWMDRFANIAVKATTLPRDEPFRRLVLAQLRGTLTSIRLPPHYFADAVALLAQQAPLVFQSPGELAEFLASLRRMLCLVLPELRARLAQTIERVQSSPAPPP